MSSPRPSQSPSQSASQLAPALHAALGRVAQRLRRARSLSVVLLLLCALLVSGVLGRALALTAGLSPPLWALALLAGIIGLCAVAALLARELAGKRVTLAQAAVVADREGGYKDEFTSALWFSEHTPADQRAADRPDGAPAAGTGKDADWITHHLARATATAGGLDAARVAPWVWPRSTWAAAALAVVFFAMPALTPAMRESLQRMGDAGEGGVQAARARQIRELIKDTADAEVAKKLEQALSALESQGVSESQKRKALAEAKESVDRQNMEMNSMREGLLQLAERLRDSKETLRSGEGKPGEQADRAKELLDRMLDPRGRQPHSADLDPEALAREKALEKLLEQASKATGSGEGQHLESAQPKAVVDRLEKIASQLEQSSSANSAMRELTQMQQLQVQQTTVQSAGRYSSSQAQQNPMEGTPSPDSGDTVMSGGIMFRTAAVAKGDKPSQTQEGSKSGAAAGDSQADPVLGNKSTPLAVKLKKEAVRKEGEDGESGAEGWYYKESRAQPSQVALQSVRASTRYVQGEAMEPEQISVKHRQVVKDYFLNLHEVKPQ